MKYKENELRGKRVIIEFQDKKLSGIILGIYTRNPLSVRIKLDANQGFDYATSNIKDIEFI